MYVYNYIYKCEKLSFLGKKKKPIQFSNIVFSNRKKFEPIFRNNCSSFVLPNLGYSLVGLPDVGGDLHQQLTDHKLEDRGPGGGAPPLLVHSGLVHEVLVLVLLHQAPQSIIQH